MRNSMKLGTLPALVMCTVLLGSACSSTQSASQSEDLPVVDVHGDGPPIESFESLSEYSDAIVHARLVEVVDGWRYREDNKEDVQAPADEFVGLVFEIIEVIDGELDTNQVTVAHLGYTAERETKKRTGEVTLQEVSLDDIKVQKEYVFPIVFVDSLDSYQIYSLSTLSEVKANGELKPVAKEDHFSGLDVETVEDVQSESENS